MITFIKYLVLLISILLLAMSCEDVIDVKLENADPRLVIEASLDWEKGTAGNEQLIKLSMSSPYIDQPVTNSVTGALVTVTNNTDATQVVFTDQNDGTYTTDEFVPILNQSYTLQVVYDNQTYIATETLMPVTDINEVDQSVEGGFDDEAIEVNVRFTDPEEENYYLFKFHEQGDVLPVLYDVKDEFVNGNEITVFYEKTDNEQTDEKKFEPGDNIDIQLFGISKQYYHFMHLLIEQAEYAGDPFSSTPALLKGNCINPANPSNFAFGYFRLTQTVKATYTVQ